MTPPTVQVDARVDLDGCTVEGELRWTGDLAWVDPFAGIPEPEDDRTILRTWPGRPRRGATAFAASVDGITFRTELPRRFDDLGCLHGALFAHGGFMPVPLQGGRLAPVAWTATVRLPEGAAGALQHVAGTDVLAWSGVAEQLSLAVASRGRVTELGAVALVTKGRPRRSLLRELPRAHAGVLAPGSVSVVEAPLRRRLARAGPGLVLLSDRAFRVTPPFARFHRVAVGAAVAEAALPSPDPFARALHGAVRARDWGQSLRGDALSTWLGRVSWVPAANVVLYAGNVPFHADLLERTWPSDPLADDLDERFAPAPTGRWAAAQLDLLGGDGTATAVADGLAVGLTMPAAVGRAGLPFEVADDLRRPVPSQDYRVEGAGGRLVVQRDAPADAAPETTALRLGDRTVAWTFMPGASELPYDGEGFSFDPRGVIRQASRAGERQPAGLDLTVAAWLATVDFEAAAVEAGVVSTLRRPWNTRSQASVSVSTTPTAPIVLRLAHAWKRGRLLDGLTRVHRFVLSGAASLVDPDTALVTGAGVVLDAGLSWAFDDRELRTWPHDGARVSLGPVASIAPGSADRAVAMHASASSALPFGPRVQLAGHWSGSAAAATLPHRRLSFGGLGNLASFPDLPLCPLDLGGGCAPPGSLRTTGALELRWAAIRGASVPAPLAWGDELQLLGGAEAGAMATEEGTALAAGAVAGAGFVADVFGLDPNFLGVTVAVPVAVSGATGPVKTGIDKPRVWLRWSQRF